MKKADLQAIMSGISVTSAILNGEIGGSVAEFASMVLWGVAVVFALFAIGEYINQRPR